MLTLPGRLDAVRRTGLLDTGPEEPFDRLTRLACELLDAPFGFVTVVDERRSFWKSCVGITSNELADRQNPVGESFCQYIIATDEPVIIGDARLDPMTRDNPSIESMGVIAWAGFPVRSPDGFVLGSFCVVDSRPRQWTAQDLRTLEVLSHAAGGEVALRVAADAASREADDARAAADRYQQLALTMQESLLPRDLPTIDGLDLAAAYRLGGDDVLGDFYDAVQTPTGWALFLGDVAGRGAQAARTSALAKYTLRAGALRASSPAIVLTELDSALHRWYAETTAPGFVTCAYLSLRASEGGFVARICTAGHPAAFIRRADGSVEAFGQPSSPLGILPRLSIRIDETELRPGDLLVLRTDAPIDDAALRAGLGTGPADHAQAVADTLLDHMLQATETPIRDDTVVVALRIR
ncbi:protein serine phosphatase with GAF(s) sensor(s) [Actinoplanes friuliensis DSM 7358]|uniref:Protein serine phosphatase with GAF(S) sensor(S) n=2 Tax=Actinoplanes friuliensis TaxID=196914 RepID=U5VXW8_9ACTN|nr:protein serine phosphatase with GAF(s) sensor(s) [Actinoplanes friuliensis DSM 7358]